MFVGGGNTRGVLIAVQPSLLHAETHGRRELYMFMGGSSTRGVLIAMQPSLLHAETHGRRGSLNVRAR